MLYEDTNLVRDSISSGGSIKMCLPCPIQTLAFVIRHGPSLLISCAAVAHPLPLVSRCCPLHLPLHISWLLCFYCCCPHRCCSIDTCPLPSRHHLSVAMLSSLVHCNAVYACPPPLASHCCPLSHPIIVVQPLPTLIDCCLAALALSQLRVPMGTISLMTSSRCYSSTAVNFSLLLGTFCHGARGSAGQLSWSRINGWWRKVVTWRLFYVCDFLCKCVSPGQPVEGPPRLTYLQWKTQRGCL